MAIKISLAGKKDRKRLLNFFRHYGGMKLIEKRVDCYLCYNFTVIAKDNGRIVGVLQWYAKENPEDGLAEFEEVFVLKKYRSKGIGSMITGYAIRSVNEYFRKLRIKPRKIFLFVSKKNMAARKLYEKHGFRKVASVGNLFRDNVKELIYSLRL